MRTIKFVFMLLIMLTSKISIGQYTIYATTSPYTSSTPPTNGVNKLCMGGSGGSGYDSWFVLFNGTTKVPDNTLTWYVNDPSIYQMYAGASNNGLGYTTLTGYGNFTVYAKSTATNQVYASKVMTSFPIKAYYGGFDYVMSGNSTIYNSNTYTVNNDAKNILGTYGFGTATWSLYNTTTANAYVNQGYAINTSGVVTAGTINNFGNGILVVENSFQIAQSPCGNQSNYAGKSVTKLPYATSNNAAVCATTVLSTNVVNAWDANSTTNYNPKFTYEWKNAANFLQVNTSTFTPSVAGTYYCVVKQYNKTGINTYSATPSLTLQSNNVVVSTAVGMPTSNHTISGTLSGSSYILCKMLNVNNTSTIAANVKQYRIDVCDNSTGSVLNSTGVVTGTFTSKDITSLFPSAGTYKVRVYVGNECALNATYSQSIVSVTSGPSATITLNTTNTDLATFQSTTVSTTNNTVSTAINVGRHSIFNISNNSTTSTTCGLSSKVEKWNSVMSTWGYPNGVNPMVRNLNTFCNSTIPAQSIGLLSAGVTGYTPGWLENPANAANGTTFRVTYTITNDCGSKDVFVIFTFNDGLLYKTSPLVENNIATNNISTYPNPCTSALNFSISLAEKHQVTLQLLSSDGKIIFSTAKFIEKGTQILPIDMNAFTNGLYYYQATIGEQRFNGKIIKQ